jgi:beta-galactosidase
MITFPDNFVWGASTASYQIEGGWLEGGKGFSIWDAFTHIPGKIADGSTGDVACDHYHRWRDDVALMADLGLKAYRLSIAWSRIQPSGRGAPNSDGIRFYSELFDELLKHGITPWVTLYHWDLPLALQFELDGWLNPALASIFKNYAAICFEHFGDRVKHWITINEPWVISLMGHGEGSMAPGRVSTGEPYRAGHTLLRAHAMAVHEYRSRFQPAQKGRIALVTNCDWREPMTKDPSDVAAAQRALEFFLGWFADPVHRGDYPECMRERLGDRLPHFTPEESALLAGSQDFFGLNHYTTMYASALNAGTDQPENAGGVVQEDQGVRLSPHRDWMKTEMGWPIVPWGFRNLLRWIDARYNHPEIVVTENGCALPDTLDGNAVDDDRRIAYLDAYLSACHEAIAQGVNLRGYFVWSLMDNLEWASGLARRFGLCYVDYPSGRRIPKLSAHWYSQVMRLNTLHVIPDNPFRNVPGSVIP